jgi:hypothetical protein
VRWPQRCFSEQAEDLELRPKVPFEPLINRATTEHGEGTGRGGLTGLWLDREPHTRASTPAIGDNSDGHSFPELITTLPGPAGSDPDRRAACPNAGAGGLRTRDCPRHIHKRQRSGLFHMKIKLCAPVTISAVRIASWQTSERVCELRVSTISLVRRADVHGGNAAFRGSYLCNPRPAGRSHRTWRVSRPRETHTS